jgi:hypothetical protein
MFGWFKPKEKHRSKMTVKDVMSVLHSKYPGLVTRGQYVPPTHRCSKWILLRGPLYDSDFKASVLVDATMMYDWAAKHAISVGTSDEQREAAKNYFPKWVKNANPDDESVTLLDESMHGSFKDWDLDFIMFGWAKVWCPDCHRFTDVFGGLQAEFQRTQDKLQCVGHSPDWVCEEGHALKRDFGELIRFF